MRAPLLAFFFVAATILLSAFLFQGWFRSSFALPLLPQYILISALSVFAASTVFVARILSRHPAFAVLAPVSASMLRILLVAVGAVLAVQRFPEHAAPLCCILAIGIVASLLADQLTAALIQNEGSHGR